MAASTFRPRAILGTTAFMLAVAGAAPAWADGAGAPKPLALRTIMQGLGKNMQLITGRIANEDWTAVATLAQLLAEHPQPPAGEKLRILAFLGTNAGTFEAHDETTHHAARALAEAALRKDGQAVISAFANVQSTCLACHQSFRKPFVLHFYGQQNEGGK
jgi:cytochrome c556